MDTNQPTGAQTLSQQVAVQSETDFLNGFEEADRNYLTEKGYKSAGDLLNAAKAADKYAGVDFAKMVALPSEQATPEELAEFYGKLGRPENAEGYKLPLPQGDDGSFAKAIAPVMFEAGLTSAQAAKLAEGWNNFAATAAKAQEEAYQKEQSGQMEALKAEWGADYDKNEEIARQAARKYGLDQTALDKLERALGSKPLMQLMHKLGVTTMDADIKGVTGMRAAAGSYTPSEARAKLEALKSDKEWGAKFLASDPQALKLFNDLTDAAMRG